MNIDDERTASPMAGDAPERRRLHANPSADKEPKDARNGIGDPGIGSFARLPLPPLPTLPLDADRESASISSYFRYNLPAILIVCIIAAAIGVAIGSHFAAEPAGLISESRPYDAYLQDRMDESPAMPSDTLIQRIEEMRRIAAEDGMGDVAGIAATAGTEGTAGTAETEIIQGTAPSLSASPSTFTAPVAKRPEQGMEQGAAARQPATGIRSGDPCTAASMALALCDHR